MQNAMNTKWIAIAKRSLQIVMWLMLNEKSTQQQQQNANIKIITRALYFEQRQMCGPHFFLLYFNMHWYLHVYLAVSHWTCKQITIFFYKIQDGRSVELLNKKETKLQQTLPWPKIILHQRVGVVIGNII